MKTVLVTGGAGFIGSNLCEALLAEENKVICVDNYITSNKRNVEHLLKNENFHLHYCDIVHGLHIREHIDEIYNLACPASPADFKKFGEEILMVCSQGVLNMLRLAREHNAKFLQASTSEVYGNPLEHPQKESYFGNVNCIGERAPYDEGKRFAETLITTYGKKYGIDVKIARIFNTYGPRMRQNDGRVIPNFITQALQNKPLTVYGNGQQTRSFCYVSDMVTGLIALMKSPLSTPVNLGSTEEITMLELANKIITLTNSKSRIIFSELPADDPAKRRPDITLAKSYLKWHPKVSLDEGLEKTIEYFKSPKI